MDDISDIKHYYDETYDEDSRLERHQHRDLNLVQHGVNKLTVGFPDLRPAESEATAIRWVG